MTVDASTSAPGSGTYRAIKTPPDLPAIGAPLPSDTFGGVPCAVIRDRLLVEALRIADTAKRLRLRTSRVQADANAFLAARGISPTGAALRP